MKKRVLSLFLAITLCLTLTPTGALAAEGQPPEQMVTATQEAETPTPALEEKEEEKTTPAQTGAGENAPPANPEENPTEDAPAAAEKNTADGETDKETAAATGRDESKADGSPSDDDAAKVQNQLVMAAAAGPDEPTMMGQNNLLALADEGQTPANAQNSEGGGIYVAPGSPTEGGGGTYISGEDTRTEIRCTTKPSLIQRSYNGTTDGGKISIDLGFTDGTNEINLKEGTGFTAKKTFDSADAGRHTVTVEIELIGDAAAKYKLKAGEEKFEIGGYIDKATPELTVSLSKTACTAGEKILPLLSVEGAPKDAEVTYYYLAAELKDWAGSSDAEGGTSMPAIDGNTAISVPGTYYVYAKSGETKNYEEERSATVELTVTEPAAASVSKADGTVSGTYKTLPAALDAAQDGDTVKLLADHTTNWSDVEAGEYATLAVVRKTLTLDLNGMTVDYLTVGDVVPDEAGGILESYDGNLTVVDNAQGGSCGKIKDLEFVQGSLAIQGGRIGGSLTCDRNSGTVTISGGTVCYVTVGDGATVTVTGGTGHAGTWCNDGTLNITDGTFGNVNFLNNGGTIAISGGTFGTITNINGSGSIPLMPLLADNYAFYQGDNAQNSTEKTLTNVTVRPHTHSFENGKCDCGASYVASVTTSNGVTNNYTSLDDALDAAKDGDTVKLLGDAEITKWRSLTAAITLDLNGKTITTQSNAELYIYAQVIVQDNSTGKNGGMAGTYLLNVQEKGDLIIQSGTFDGKITINVGKLTIEGGIFKQEVDLRGGDSDSVFFSGGTFTTLFYPKSSGSFLDLLADGCAFYDNDGNLVNAAEISGTFLDNVQVQQHTHSFTDGACACGYTCPHTSVNENGVCKICNKRFAASVTAGEDVTYYDTFGSALSYATRNDGCTLKLLADVTGTTVMINNPFLFDLNGHNVDALSVDARATIKDSGTTKGRIGKVTVSNEKVTDLTLGGLLEEGYAFKYGNGYWANDSYLQTTEGAFVTVEKAPIQSVNVYAKDKNNKEVSTTIAYGTTGEVTLVSSCQLSETSGGNLSCAWYKLTDDAAIPPLEGAAGTSYKLPADLPAGTYTYRVTFTSDYYSKSAEITITVTPISLVGATVTVSNLTYNGNPQEPTVTVKLGDETLSRDNDYTVQVTKQTDAGSYKLTIKGGGNYSGEIKDVEWKIEPMKIDSVMVSSDISKTYDGTATVTKTAEEWAKVLTFKTLSASGVVDVPSEAYTISDAYFVEKSGEETIHSPDAGEKYGISFKITLKSSNYVLQNYYDEEPATAKEYTQSGGATFAIAQADAPTNIRNGALNVINGTKLKYTYDAKQLLPDAPKGTYGNVSYNCRFPFNLENGYYVNDIAIDDSVLTLTIAALSGRETGKIGTIPIYITTDNYESFDLPLDLYAVDKITPVVDGDITASNITYSDELSKSTISGKMKNPTTGDEVKGTFAWTDGTIKPAASDNYEAEWTFTPAAGYEKYATATGTVTVKVNKATPTFTAPTAQENLTYTGQEQALITAGMTDHGTMQYSLTENGTYSQDIPTGTDAGAYTVWYRVIGDANHNDTAPASVAVRIGKKPLTITGVTAASKPYDGTTNADISGVTFDNVNLNRGTDYTVTANFDDAGVGDDKNVTATVTLMEQTAKNYALEQSSISTTGSITAKEVNVTITPNGGTYGSVVAATAELPGAVEGDNVPVTLTYTGNDYNSTTVPVNAGSYTVTASIANKNYTLTGNTTAAFVIAPKAVTVSGITANDKVYDGTNDATLDCSNAKFDGILENDKLTVAAKGMFEKAEAGQQNVAISGLTLGGASAANYVLAGSSNQTRTTATITAKKVTVTITPNGGTYGGTITPATVTANDVVGEDGPEITLTYTGTANDGSKYNGTTPPTKAGTYTIKASTTDKNYTLDANTATAEFIVAKRGATVTPDNKSKVYQEKDPDLTYKVDGVLGGETLTGITLTRAEGENAGEYTITATADAGANPNYKVTFAEGKFTIDPKSVDGATVKLGKALTANGAEQTQTVEKVLLDGKELPADSYTVKGNTATAPGIYTLTITAKGNYTGTVEQPT